MLSAAAVGACEWDEAGRRLVWRCSGVPGGATLELRARISLASPYSPSLRSCVGPVCLRFTVPMVSATKLAVRYLHIGGSGSGGSGSGPSSCCCCPRLVAAVARAGAALAAAHGEAFARALPLLAPAAAQAFLREIRTAMDQG